MKSNHMNLKCNHNSNQSFCDRCFECFKIIEFSFENEDVVGFEIRHNVYVLINSLLNRV
jgi:hypothetical protein